MPRRRNQQIDPDAPIMNVRETADYLRVSISTVYRLAARGEFPPGFKVGDWRFSRASLDAWMVQQMKVSRTAVYPPRVKR
jgi:excisionase family DNA binding protein